MSDLQKLIEDIRDAIVLSDTVSPDKIKKYAKDYVEECVKLNARMKESVLCIRAGNVAEGIRLAELTPKLPDLYNVLDFAERDVWNEYVSALGFDMPPLQTGMMAELNDAYLKMWPLEPLLIQYRFLALNGSPIRERLAVLRAISKNDPESTAWKEDQEKFEKARIEELKKEIPKALETKNVSQIRLLYRELSAPDWFFSPPPELRRQVVGAILLDYAESLRERHLVFDHEDAIKFNSLIHSTLASERVTMPSAIQQLIQPAVQWLHETQQQSVLKVEFENAMAILHGALEEEEPLSDLERLYYVLGNAATQAGTVIPPELERFYRSTVARQQMATSRRTILKVVSVLAVCLLIGVGVAFGIMQRFHADRVTEAISSMERIEEEQRFDDIEAALNRLEKEQPEIVKNARVIEVMERLRRMLANDNERGEEFSRCHSEAVEALQAKPDIDELERIRNIVDRAGELVRTQQEKNAFEDLQREFEADRMGRVRELNERNKSDLSKISTKHTAIIRNVDLTLEEAIDQLRELEKELQAFQKTLQQQPSDVVELVQLTVGDLVKRVAESRSQMEEKSEQIAELQRLIKTAPDWRGYQSALQRFVSNFPRHPAATDAADVLKEWNTIREVATLLEELSSDFSGKADDFAALQKESASFLNRYQQFSTRISGTPSNLFSPGRHLEELSKTKIPSPESFDKLGNILKTCSQNRLFPWIEVSTDKWYYLTMAPDKASDYFYVTSFGGDRKSYKIQEKDFDPAKVPKVTPHGFAVATLKKIDEMKDTADDVVLAIVGDLFKRTNQEPGIDPILQCIILEMLITDVSNIDPFFATNFAPILRVVKSSGVDSLTNWIDVNSSKTATLRNTCKTNVSRLQANLMELVNKTRRERAQFQDTLKQLQPHFDWVAVLTRQDQQWDCAVVPEALDGKSGDLYILRQNANKTVRPVKVGTVTSGRINLQFESSSFLQCAPVFLVKP